MTALPFFKRKPEDSRELAPVDLTDAIYLGKASPEFLSQLSSGVKAAYGSKTAKLLKDSFVFNMRGHTGTLGTNTDGTISFRILDDNGRLIGQAGADSLRTQGITYGVMSLASFATGQYFLAQINNQLVDIRKNLSSVQTKVDTIAHRQLAEKFAELKAIYDELQKICQFQSYYASDTAMRQNTCSQVKGYMVQSLSLIEFFKVSLTYLQSHLSEESPEKAYADMREAMMLHAAWRKALEAHALCTCIEQQVTETHDHDYLESRIRDLETMNDEYEVESIGLYHSLGMNVNRTIMNYYQSVNLISWMFDWYTDYDAWKQEPLKMEENLQKSLKTDQQHLSAIINAMELADNYNQGDLVCIRGELYRLPATPLPRTA